MPTIYAIPNGRTVFDATLYTGTAAVQSISNADNGTTGFKPDLVWIKSRSNAYNNYLTNSVDGPTIFLVSNSNAAEGTYTTGLTSFNTNGFSLGTDNGSVNGSGSTFVAWQWQAGQNTTTTNTTGTITSTVSANTTAGFSILNFTTTGVNCTVGHGLGATPSMIILKNRTGAVSWGVWHIGLTTPSTALILLDTTAAQQAPAATFWNSTVPTSSVFSLGTAWAASNYVAYCWAPVAGFSAFGSYTGNASNDGPFIYTGFRPKYVMYKASSVSGAWVVVDSSRDLYNVEQNLLLPSGANAEAALGVMDFVSNGFKIRYNGTGTNGSGENIIYAAFAENPFKYANAR